MGGANALLHARSRSHRFSHVISGFGWGGAWDLDRDQCAPVIGSHCVGTNHQDIDGIERVVFLGDSITVGNQLEDCFPPETLDLPWIYGRTADVMTCDVSGLAGFDQPVRHGVIADNFMSIIQE